MATRRKRPFYTGTTSVGGDVRRLRRDTYPKRADATKVKRPRVRAKRRK